VDLVKIIANEAKTIHRYKNLIAKVLKCCADIYFNGPTYRTHLTYIARQVIVDRHDDGCVAETCSLVLLT
jgi:hypothetical protein